MYTINNWINILFVPNISFVLLWFTIPMDSLFVEAASEFVGFSPDMRYMTLKPCICCILSDHAYYIEIL